MSECGLPVWDIRDALLLSCIPRALWPRAGSDTHASHVQFAQAACDAWADIRARIQALTASTSSSRRHAHAAAAPPPPHAVLLVRIHTHGGGEGVSPPLRFIIKIADGASGMPPPDGSALRGRLLAHDAAMMVALRHVPCMVRHVWSFSNVSNGRGVLVETYIPPAARGVTNLMHALCAWPSYFPTWSALAAFLRYVWRALRAARAAHPEWQHNDLKTDNVLVCVPPPDAHAHAQAHAPPLDPHVVLPVIIDFEFAHAPDVPCPHLIRAPACEAHIVQRDEFALDAVACSAYDVHLLLTDMLRVVETVLPDVNAAAPLPPWRATLRAYMDDLFPPTAFPTSGLTRHSRLGADLRHVARCMDAACGVDAPTRALAHPLLMPSMEELASHAPPTLCALSSSSSSLTPPIAPNILV